MKSCRCLNLYLYTCSWTTSHGPRALKNLFMKFIVFRSCICITFEWIFGPPHRWGERRCFCYMILHLRVHFMVHWISYSTLLSPLHFHISFAKDPFYLLSLPNSLSKFVFMTAACSRICVSFRLGSKKYVEFICSASLTPAIFSYSMRWFVVAVLLLLAKCNCIILFSKENYELLMRREQWICPPKNKTMCNARTRWMTYQFFRKSLFSVTFRANWNGNTQNV